MASNTNINRINLESFKEESGNINDYLDRYAAICELTRISDDKDKVNGLVSCVGSAPYACISKLVYPKKVTSLKYDELTDVLIKAFDVKPLESYSLFKFQLRTLKAGESIRDLYKDLKDLCRYLKFKELDERLRDQLMVSIRHQPYLKDVLDHAPNWSDWTADQVFNEIEAREKLHKSNDSKANTVNRTFNRRQSVKPKGKQ